LAVVRLLALVALQLGFATLLTTQVKGMWEQLSQDELIATSDLIIVGELIGKVDISFSAQQPAVRLGVLRVDEVLKGGEEHGAVLLALPSASGSSTNLSYNKGDRGLWFLRAGPPGTAGLYVADHPQRFMNAERAGEEIELLRERLK
jgi:hypothetical protein